jgi:hypothetical protein
MKYLRNKFIIPVLVVTLLSSCDKDYLDINDDPNRVTDANITPELIFTQAADAVGRRQASGNFGFINNWMGYSSTSGDFAIDQTETSYAIDFSFGDALWQNHYGVLFDLANAKQKAQEKGDGVLAGASMVLAAKLWQELVDIYGNVPYTQAFKNSETRSPAYDDDAAIYTAVQKSLDSAIFYLEGTERSTFNSVDIITGGDPAKWIRFANTLKLRMLIRQSEVAGFNPAPEIAKIIAKGGVLQSGESINVNPGYVNENNKQSPFYANYGFTPTGADASTVTRANAYFVSLLTTAGDPRKERYFAAPSGGGAITGTVYGLSAGNPRGAQSSKFGAGLIASATQPQWILTSVESLFLQAEAIARGWMPGDAKTAYEAAVNESFIWLGVPNAVTAAATYRANNPLTAEWASVAAGTTLQKAKFITYQKYISLAGIDALEAWADLRRLNMIPNTGYISANPSKISTTLPLRLLYPQSEYTTNADNVNAQGTINQFTTKIFWQP